MMTKIITNLILWQLILLISCTTQPAQPTIIPPLTPIPAPTKPPIQFAGTVRVGAPVSLTGTLRREGKDVQQGYLFWAEWVNEMYGGIIIDDKPYQVELIFYDDKSSPDQVSQLTEKLILQDNVDFLLSPYSSRLTQVAVEVTERYNRILLTSTASSESLYKPEYRYFFGIPTTAGNYTQSSLEKLALLGARTLAVAYKDTMAPTAMAEGALHWAMVYGLEVVGYEQYSAEVTDVSNIISRFRQQNPDILVVTGNYNEAILFVKTAQNFNFNPKAVVMTVAPSNPQFVRDLGDSATHVIGPTQWEPTMFWQGDYLGSTLDYTEAYVTRWGELPTYQAAESTAAGIVLMAALEQANSLEVNAVDSALHQLDIMTFFGPIRFDETGKNVAKQMGAVQIQRGQILVVAPEAVAITDLVYPKSTWMTE